MLKNCWFVERENAIFNARVVVLSAGPFSARLSDAADSPLLRSDSGESDVRSETRNLIVCGQSG
jgi:hypothetical protein